MTTNLYLLSSSMEALDDFITSCKNDEWIELVPDKVALEVSCLIEDLLIYVDSKNLSNRKFSTEI